MMHNWNGRERSVLLAALLVTGMVTTAGMTFADNVVNNIDTTIDSDLETVTTTVGTPVSVGFYIRPTTGSGDAPGCNATGSNPAYLTISPPAGVSVSPTTLTFVGCDSPDTPVIEGLQTATFTASSAGTYNFTTGNFSMSGGKSGSQWNFANAQFTLIVTATDTTPPEITPNISGTLGDNGWYTSNVDVSWNVSDPESGIASTSGCDPTTINYDTTGVTLTCTATNGAGLSSSKSVTIKRDATAPTVTATPDRGPDHNGWYNHPLTITFTGEDATSGIAACDSPVTYSGPDGEDITVTGSCTDNAGNVGFGSYTFDYDATPPTVSIGGISAGQQFDFGDPLPEVTCNATDNLSGVESCTISPSPLPTSVGTHTITATAKDKAGNTAPTSITYTIKAWTIVGFKPPVDNPPLVNVVKNGSTVPLKFEVFKTISGEELTDPSIVKQPLKAQKISCTTLDGSPTDEIELTATGGTSLRYDETEGQFIYNWKTPTQKDTCWKVTIEFQDGYSSIHAYFRLK